MPDDLTKREHEQGDPDGMGGCRGVLNGAAIMLVIGVAVWYVWKCLFPHH